MSEATLTEALEREHVDIDASLEAFMASVDAGQPDVDELRRAASALRRHIYLEEEFLFPPLRSAGVVGPVLVMLREHGEIWHTLDRLESAASRGAVGNATERCRELLERLEAHNAKEEPLIYPEGDAKLSQGAKQELHDFIERGSMPEGWVCAMVPGSGGSRPLPF